MAGSSDHAREEDGAGWPRLSPWMARLFAIGGLLVVASTAFRHLLPHQLTKDDLSENCGKKISDDQALREISFWDNYNFDHQALWTIPLERFQGATLHDGDLNRVKYLWDFFLPHYSCPHKEKIGVLAENGDGGKWLCGVQTLLQHPGCVVYSFGSNGDMSFERGILARTHCEVHVFDPTLAPAQKEEVERVPEVVLHEYGLAANDSYIVLDGDSTHTLGRRMDGFHTKSMSTIMKVEFHNMQPVALMRNVMARMIMKDFRVFSTEANTWWSNSGYDFMEYAYLHVNKSGDVVTGPPNVPAGDCPGNEIFPKCSHNTHEPSQVLHKTFTYY